MSEAFPIDLPEQAIEPVRLRVVKQISREDLLETAKGIHEQEQLIKRKTGLEVSQGSRVTETDPNVRATLLNMVAMIAREAQGAILTTPEAEMLELGREDADYVSTGTDTMIGELHERFMTEKNQKLHPGLNFKRVELALRASPKAMLAVLKMQAAGHEPDVYNFDQNGFDIGTCSKETPLSTRNCVYDEEAEKGAVAWSNELEDGRPKENCKPMNGNALSQAAEMDLELMDVLQLQILLSKGDFDSSHEVWAKTGADIREKGFAYFMSRDKIGNYVPSTTRHHYNKADRYYEDRGWRGTRRINWAA